MTAPTVRSRLVRHGERLGEGAAHFRARLGDRCSLTYRAGTLPKERGPLTLWLRPCAEVERGEG
jgi:hypothetical protein